MSEPLDRDKYRQQLEEQLKTVCSDASHDPGRVLELNLSIDALITPHNYRTGMKIFIENFHQMTWSDGGASLEMQRAAADVLMRALDAADNGPQDARNNPVSKAMGLNGRQARPAENLPLLTKMLRYVLEGESESKAADKALEDYQQTLPDNQWDSLPDSRTLKNWFKVIKPALPED